MDDNLQAYIQKMLEIQEEQRNKPLTEEELKQIALDLGMTEEDWLASQQSFAAHLSSGKGHLLYKNYPDAIQELEQAVALKPNHLQANHQLAQAYKGLWVDTQEEVHQQKAQTFAQHALRIKAGHKPSVRLLSELRQKELFLKETRQRRWLNIAAIAGVALVLFALGYFYMYNVVVNKEEAVTQRWAQVRNVYQRQAELLPKLIKTVEAELTLQPELLEQVQNRQDLTKKLPDKEDLQTLEKKQQQLQQSLDGLWAKAERQPNLTNAQSFRDLRAEIEGSQNRITVERKKFNEAVQAYNSTVKKFPFTLLGYEPKAYFK